MHVGGGGEWQHILIFVFKCAYKMYMNYEHSKKRKIVNAIIKKENREKLIQNALVSLSVWWL